ncbi:hypothetical protein F8M41_025856 [Gigaspora margarita]|uniref:Transmembrane protein n=1 Tax=Gigaspora margarita TaxID=4874 RepID=A0A8H4AAR9_GIGMA|nr:hypothetical protein F8M41_025856 [Gigaspora margarita]
MSFKSIKLILIIFLVGIINYRSGINAENSVGNPTNTLGTPPSIDNSSSGKVCATLNACSEAKIMCGSALVLPKLHSLNHYSASNKCQCSIFFYKNLTQCLACYKNAGYNYVVDDLSKWQKNCSALGFAFADSTSYSDNSSSVLIYSIMCAAAIIIFIIVFIIWYLKKRQNCQVKDGNIYNDPKDYSGKKEYKVAQNQNTQMQKHASETNSNWSEFSQNTLVNNLGQIDEHFTKEGTKYESQRIVNGDEKFIIQEFNTFEQITTQKFNTLEQSTTQELNALKQTPTKEFNTFEQAIIHEQNATREFSAFDRPTDQEVNVSKNSITLEIGDHNDQYNHYSVDYSDYNSFYRSNDIQH